MAIPQNYSMELPIRCGSLLEELWPSVQGVHVQGGPATTTFLVAMAYPILLMPIERIIKAHEDRIADERHVELGLAEMMRAEMAQASVANSTFFHRDVWSYVKQSLPLIT